MIKVNNISEEILKLSKLKEDGIISDEEIKKRRKIIKLGRFNFFGQLSISSSLSLTSSFFFLE